jgi:hypothetical protein
MSAHERAAWLEYLGLTKASWKAVAAAIRVVEIVDRKVPGWLPITEFDEHRPGVLLICWNSPTEYLEVEIGQAGDVEWFYRHTTNNVSKSGIAIDEHFVEVAGCMAS